MAARSLRCQMTTGAPHKLPDRMMHVRPASRGRIGSGTLRGCGRCKHRSPLELRSRQSGSRLALALQTVQQTQGREDSPLPFGAHLPTFPRRTLSPKGTTPHKVDPDSTDLLCACFGAAASGLHTRTSALVRTTPPDAMSPPADTREAGASMPRQLKGCLQWGAEDRPTSIDRTSEEHLAAGALSADISGQEACPRSSASTGPLPTGSLEDAQGMPRSPTASSSLEVNVASASGCNSVSAETECSDSTRNSPPHTKGCDSDPAVLVPAASSQVYFHSRFVERLASENE